LSYFVKLDFYFNGTLKISVSYDIWLIRRGSHCCMWFLLRRSRGGGAAWAPPGRVVRSPNGSAIDPSGPASKEGPATPLPAPLRSAAGRHNGFRSTAVPLSGGFRPAGQTACPAFDGYLPEESSNRRSGLAMDVGLLNDGEQETENRRIRRRFTRVSVANVEGSARAPERLPRNGESARVCGGA